MMSAMMIFRGPLRPRVSPRRSAPKRCAAGHATQKPQKKRWLSLKPQSSKKKKLSQQLLSGADA